MLFLTYLFFCGLIVIVIGYYEGLRWQHRNNPKIVYKFIDQLNEEQVPPAQDIFNQYTQMFQELPILL